MRALVPSLVRELRSCKPHSLAKKIYIVYNYVGIKNKYRPG